MRQNLLFVIITVILWSIPSLYPSYALQGEALAPRSAEEQKIIDAYSKTNKAVVNVNTRVDVGDYFGAYSQEGSGSGVVIDRKEGLIITNYHVIEGAKRIIITLASGEFRPVKLIGQAPDNDLALLQFQQIPPDLVDIPLADSSKLEVGQRVLAIGNPFGLNRTLTTGIISSLGRTIRAESGRLIEDIIQIDAAINPGNSGGPLIDTAGRLVGINTAILSRVGESAGIGFAIPANQVSSAIPQLKKFGRVLRPKIGAVIVDTEYGPMLLDVQPGSPASVAGLSGARRKVKKGMFYGYAVDFSKADFILAVGNQRVRTRADILDLFSKVKPKQKVDLVVRQGLRSKRARKVVVRPELG